jgi:hypothetical protein
MNSRQWRMRSSTGFVVAVFALVFEKAGDLAHVALCRAPYSAACMAAVCALSSLRARRYSTGMTLRNFGYQVDHSARILAATVESGKMRVARNQEPEPRGVASAHVGHDFHQAVRFKIAGDGKPAR